MIWYILLVGLPLIVTWGYVYSQSIDAIVATFAAIMVAVVGATIATILVVIIDVATSTPEEYTRTQALVSVKDGSSVEGRGGFLFGGYVRGVPSYSYYLQEPNGSYKLHSLPAENVTIFEEERDDGVLISHCERVENGWTAWTYHPGIDKCKTREFHIPVGSIVRTFELDG